jgi:hypothetical protein
MMHNYMSNRLNTAAKKAVVIAALLLCSAGQAFAASTLPDTPPPAWDKGAMAFSLIGEYFTSKANFGDSRSSYYSLPNGGSFDTLLTRLTGRYAISKEFSIFTGVEAAQSQATEFSVTSTNSNIDEVYVGVDYQLPFRWLRVIPEIEGSMPTNPTDPNQTTPLTSDGVTYGRFGVFLFKRYETFRVESYLGSYIPSNGLAKRFVYSLIAEISMFHRVTLGGGVQGYETIYSDDQYEYQRLATQALADYGSSRYYAYNPALMEGKAWIGFRLAHAFTIRLGYESSIQGIRTAQGQTYLASVTFNTPGDINASEHRLQPTASPGAESMQIDNEKVDPEVFPTSHDSLDQTERMLENK